jgi:hypothetical protein
VTVSPGRAAEGHPVLSKLDLRREELLRAVLKATGADHA